MRLAAPGGPLLLPGEDANALFEVALLKGTITARYPTGRQPHDAVEVDGQVWVTDELAGRISILGGVGRREEPARRTAARRIGHRRRTRGGR